MLAKEQVWRNLLEFIDSNEMFFPEQVRSRLNPAAEEIFEEFISLMLRHKMIVPFRKSSFTNRIAYMLFWLRTKLFSKQKRVPEIYIKGPGWREPGGQSLDELISAQGD